MWGLALLLAIAAPDAAPAATAKQPEAGYRVLRASGPSAARTAAGTRLPAGAPLALGRGDSVLLLGPLGTRLYRGPGQYRVGQPAGLNGNAGPATVRIAVAATRFPGGSIRRQVVAGGTIDIKAEIGSACAGFISVPPDAQYLARGDGFPITFTVMDAPSEPAGGDFSLLVNDPTGEWYCSQRRNARGQPEIHFPRQLAGRYDVWIAVAAAGERRRALIDVVD